MYTAMDNEQQIDVLFLQGTEVTLFPEWLSTFDDDDYSEL